MKSLIQNFAVSVCICFVASIGFAQYAMEQYIPIGESIGISHVTSIIGLVETVNHSKNVVQVKEGSVVYNVDLNNNPFGPVRFWIDNTLNGRSNSIGAASDIAVGSTVEVHFSDNSIKPMLNAIWVKILGPNE